MKILFRLLLIAVPLLAVAGAGAREFPDDGVDYGACLEELDSADSDGDGALKIDEYKTFVQAYKERILCGEHLDDSEFDSEQEKAFHAIACMCRCRQGRACCEGDRAKIETAGADGPDRTVHQHYYLITVCQVTDGSILEPRCSENEEQAGAASSSKSAENEDGKVKRSFLAAIAFVAAFVLFFGLSFWAFSRCAHRRHQNKQPQPQQSAEKEQDETVAEHDDATEAEEDA